MMKSSESIVRTKFVSTSLVLISFVLIVISCKSTVGANNDSDQIEKKAVITVGNTDSLYSDILDEYRRIHIYLPESYNQSNFRYPVFYLLDSEYEFFHTSGLIDFLSSTGKIPEMIIIGINNTNRSRDLTPEAPTDIASLKFWGEIGGAEDFRSFLEKELMPHIDKKFRTEPYYIIRGQSFGGLFAFYDLLESNNPLFNAYITSSPQVSWNNKSLWNYIPQEDLKKERRKVFIGHSENDFPNEIEKFYELLRRENNDSTFLLYQFYHNEDHYSLVHKTTYEGLEFVYQNYPFNNFSDLIELENHFESLSNELGYKVDVPMGALIDLANMHLRKRDFKKGISLMEYAIKKYPEQPQVYWHMGDALSLQGNLEESTEYFKKAYLMAKKQSFDDVNEYRTSYENSINKTNQRE